MILEVSLKIWYFANDHSHKTIPRSIDLGTISFISWLNECVPSIVCPKKLIQEMNEIQDF